MGQNLPVGDPLSAERRTLQLFLACRLLVVTLLLGGSTAFYLRAGNVPIHIAPLFFLIALTYFQSLVSAFWLYKIRRFQLFSQMQVVWDLLFVTSLILWSGGSESVFSFAYLLIIIGASFLLSRRQTVFAAACATIIFGGILDLQYFRYLPWLMPDPTVSATELLVRVFVHVTAFLLTAILSGTLADRWRHSEAELKKRKVDLDELEKYNRMILAHISSGLMIVNSAGRILSFNRAATEITGYTQEEVYNRPVEEIFPGFVLFKNGQYNLVNRREGAVENKNGKMMVLGYATTATKDRHGYDAGLLVTFQDLTQLKVVEEQLQRADRMAAVGRLASGMAHEIRNPLASISGSVQLLMESSVSTEDRQLMGIVVREADRLSQLLTEFLSYARPPSPKIEHINCSALLDDLLKLLESDARFQDIELLRDFPDNLFLWVDASQLHQALWDISVNAAEAMNGVGRLRFSLKPEGIVLVEDSGPGIPKEIRGRMFDPFFSTKQKGTGLGLATVHSIVEAQGGTIQVGDSELGGAAFSLNFSLLQGGSHD